MSDNHALRRDYVIGEAVRAGKFSESRAAYWSAEYDRDPAGTEATIASLASLTEGPQPYPREILFPTRTRLSRQRAGSSALATATAPAAAPAPPAAAKEVPSGDGTGTGPGIPGSGPSPEEVAEWSARLFPEAVAAGAGPRRVTRARD